jgi:methionyl-tRNA synthetase
MENVKTILIGGAWPYANGSLHIGHIASLLPGDVLARYFRLKGAAVCYVSGSDCHGTPVTIRARQEGSTPAEVSDRYHAEFAEVFSRLGFSYDLYAKTSDERHIQFVREFHRKLYESEYVYEKSVKQAYCPRCGKVLVDRLITGKCPACGAKARGDQCDACGAILDADTILDARCSKCGSGLNFVESKQLFIAVSKLEKELTAYLAAHPGWRKNAVAFTRRYIDEGLRDRALTRDLEWGIPVPKPGYEDKRIYIWAENVLGYLSAAAQVCEARGDSFADLFGAHARHYYVHGKDNIPFHTIILPALLIGHGGGFHLPDDIISSEYLTLEGRKISTSENWAIWAKDVISRYNPDALRYFLIANGPERRDTDFLWREFVERNNGELLGAYGNFVNRTLSFIERYFGGIVPEAEFRPELKSRVHELYATVGEKIEAGQFKDALDAIMDLTRFANKFFDEQQPWKTRAEAPGRCADTLFNCVQIIANLAGLMFPFLPLSSDKLRSWLNLSANWALQSVPAGYQLPEISILFERLDQSVVEKELERLKSAQNP